MAGAGRRWFGAGRRAWLAIALVVVVIAVVVGVSRRSPTATVPLFVFAGQSNMEGPGTAADLPPALARPRADVRLWDNTAHRWGPATPSPGGTFGPELSALVRLADELGTPVAGVKVAVGGTSLAHDWDPARPDGMYVQLRTALSDAALARLPSGKRTTAAGFFWMQGEADAASADAGAAYAGNLEKLVRRVRADAGDDVLPCVFGRIRVEQPGLGAGGEAVRRAYGAVAADVGHARVVDTDDLTLRTDFIHFDSRATVTLGRRFADAWLALR